MYSYALGAFGAATTTDCEEITQVVRMTALVQDRPAPGLSTIRSRIAFVPTTQTWHGFKVFSFSVVIIPKRSSLQRWHVHRSSKFSPRSKREVDSVWNPTPVGVCESQKLFLPTGALEFIVQCLCPHRYAEAVVSVRFRECAKKTNRTCRGLSSVWCTSRVQRVCTRVGSSVVAGSRWTHYNVIT